MSRKTDGKVITGNNKSDKSINIIVVLIRMRTNRFGLNETNLWFRDKKQTTFA